MTTFRDLIEQVTHDMSGFSAANDAMTWLKQPLTAGGLNITLADVANIGNGVAEIGTELIYITNVDRQGGTISVPPWGRGFRGTTAVAHPVNERVTMSPTWPRATIGRAINQAIRGIYPGLFGVRQHVVTVDNNFSYPLPAETERVLDVRWREIGRPDSSRVKSYDVLWGQNTTDFAGGVALEVYDFMPIGSRLTVTLGVSPVQLVNESDDWNLTGLPASMTELITLGATYRLLPTLDVARLPRDAASAAEADASNAVGSAVSTANTYFSLYNARLNEERKSFDQRYPPRFRKVR